jgi:hypothetical protein
MRGLSLTEKQLEKLIDVFSKIKAEDDKHLKNDTEKTFVHTSVYQQIQEPGKSLIVGGKGSGKTALLIGHYNENKDKYIAGEIIKLDILPFQQLFSFFYVDYEKSLQVIKDIKISSRDIKDLIEPLKVSSNAWNKSLITFAVYIAAKKIISTESELQELERQTLETVINDLDSLFEIDKHSADDTKNSPIFFGLLVYFFSVIQDIVSNAINFNAPSMAILMATITKYILDNIENSRMEIEAACVVISGYLNARDLSVLLSVDRIDDYFDEFYRKIHSELEDNEENRRSIKQRKFFVSTILEGLILATRDIKRDSKYSWIHILFTLPKDKFIALRIRERAQLEEDHVVPLRWTPPELSRFVNQRIALALDFPSDKIDSSWDTLFPFTVANGMLPAVKEDSLLYLIRHSLWKPREVQMYILTIFKEMLKNKVEANEDLFRNVVKYKSKEIIRREFVEEFIVEYPSINRILNKIENSKVNSVMLYEEVCPIFHGLKLANDISSPDQIMIRLFKMGLIGTRVIKTYSEKGIEGTVKQNNQNVYYKYCYSTLSDDPFAPGVNVVFHPMFFDLLNIEHDKEYVINELRWEIFSED